MDKLVKILLCEGGDVELCARISKHILLLAFDPLSPNSLSLSFICAKHHSYHSYHIACIALHLLYCSSLYAWLDCVCASLVPNQQELHIAPQPIQGESRGVSPEPFTGNSATLVCCTKCVAKFALASAFSAISS